jgi:DnaJ-class molecular chaperone
MNYYTVLGVEQHASSKEIQTAFRGLAKQYHPDVTKDNSAASEERFKVISHAYAVLSDDAKRKQYDHALANPHMPRTHDGGPEINIEELLKRYRHPDGKIKMPKSFKELLEFGLLSLADHLQKKAQKK